MSILSFYSLCLLLGAAVLEASGQSGERRPRARELGIVPGVFPPGAHNAITDVAGVRVGHVTSVEDDDMRTGVWPG
jgi:D-aminopeptidase